MLPDDIPKAIAVAEARRDVHDSLTALSAWAADEVREKVARLEQAIERHVRKQVATGMHPAGVLSEVRIISVTAPDDAEPLRDGFGNSITPDWVDIEYRWCGSPNDPAGQTDVEVTRPYVTPFDSWNSGERPDWLKRLVAKHHPTGWPLARQADDTASKEN
jgi:hypothetical protein